MLGVAFHILGPHFFEMAAPSSQVNAGCCYQRGLVLLNYVVLFLGRVANEVCVLLHLFEGLHCEVLALLARVAGEDDAGGEKLTQDVVGRDSHQVKVENHQQLVLHAL